MAVRKIITFDDEFLRKKCKPVQIIDGRVRALFTDMAETMYGRQRHGGLAANQIGVLSRVIIADMGGGLIKLVNPRITESEGEQLAAEGCLSYPGIRGRVKRPRKLVVKGFNEAGEEITVRASGELARCLSHEIDHLDGVLFTDKAVEIMELKNRKQPQRPADNRKII